MERSDKFRCSFIFVCVFLALNIYRDVCTSSVPGIRRARIIEALNDVRS